MLIAGCHAAGIAATSVLAGFQILPHCTALAVDATPVDGRRTRNTAYRTRIGSDDARVNRESFTFYEPFGHASTHYRLEHMA